MNFRAADLIPEYLRGVDNRLTSARRPLRLELAKGSSIAGYVRNADDATVKMMRVALTAPADLDTPRPVLQVYTNERAFSSCAVRLRKTTVCSWDYSEFARSVSE